MNAVECQSESPNKSLLERKQCVSDFAVKDKTVLVRVDFNVPTKGKEGDRIITDDARIVGALETIRYLQKEGAKVVLMSHLGRPEGKKIADFSLDVVANCLAKHLGQEVVFVSDCRGELAKEAVAKLQPGQVALLENTRFYFEDEALEPKKYKALSTEDQSKVDAFVEELASLGDIFINDAFGAAHRKHASTAGVAKHLPSGYGFLIKKELEFLTNALDKPKRPFVAVLGGAKVSDKIGVVTALLEKVDSLVIGGAMANTFLVAEGVDVGASRYEKDQLELAKEIMQKAKEKGIKILLPSDYVYGRVEIIDDKAKFTYEGRGDSVPKELSALDIGEKTVEAFTTELKSAGTVLWNGPMGVAEVPEFASGTKAIAETLVSITANNSAITVVGGGDSAAAMKDLGLESEVSHVSTGGGASLELLEGKDLPGISELSDR